MELLPALRVLVDELHARRPPAVELRDRRHAVGLEPLRDELGVLPERLAVGDDAAVAAARDDQGQRAVRVLDAEEQRGVAAHGQAAHVGPRDAQVVEDALDVVDGALLRVRGGIVGHVGGRVPAGVEGDAPVAPGEEPHLQMPAPRIPRELVDEDERRARSRFLVVELGAVDVGMGHGGLLSAGGARAGALPRPPRS